MILPLRRFNPRCFLQSPLSALLPIIWFIVAVLFCGAVFFPPVSGCAQDEELQYTIDGRGATVPLPKVFKANIDISGRGFSSFTGWPQNLASVQAIDLWEKEIGWNGIYRLQYNLWELSEFALTKEKHDELSASYEQVIKRISDAGGTVILDLFGTPAGMGRVLDKKSAPYKYKELKALIKQQIRYWSCEKRYNVWYEVWNAPDVEEFFLGRKQDYLALYRIVAEAVKELQTETKVYIPVGGPSISWWFQNFEDNTILTPERSLIYELIKFCAHYNLPLNFISWHAFSTDPKAEQEITRYNKGMISLVKAWLSYFKFDPHTPLVVSEWNYDNGVNVELGRTENARIGASYILSRLQCMYEAGVDNQLYFSLEDFHGVKEGVTRNCGAFWLNPNQSDYKGGAKVQFDVLKMLSLLGDELFVLPHDDDFAGVIATRRGDEIIALLYNYSDPNIDVNYVTRHIARLKDAERKVVLSLIKSGKFSALMRGESLISGLRVRSRTKNLLKKIKEIYEKGRLAATSERRVQLHLKNLKNARYTYQRYQLDAMADGGKVFVPTEERLLPEQGPYSETVVLPAYSVTMIVLKPMEESPQAETETALPIEKQE
jgi:hypothetical protein